MPQTARSLRHQDEVDASAYQESAEGGSDKSLLERAEGDQKFHEEGTGEDEEPLETGDVDVVGDIDVDEVVDCPQIQVEGDQIGPGVFENNESICGFLEIFLDVFPHFWSWPIGFFTFFGFDLRNVDVLKDQRGEVEERHDHQRVGPDELC